MESMNIFVSYTQTTSERNAKVLSFVYSLRRDGYNATCDQILRTEQTSIDFGEMMYSSLTKATKVIVVLSREYKQKADGYLGGTGTEFRYISNHIDLEPRKYILVSLDGDHLPDYSDILPNSFNKREVLEVLPDAPKNSLLYNALNDLPPVLIPPVSSHPVMPNTVYGEKTNLGLYSNSEVDISFSSDTAFFDYRIREAFPGTRGLCEIDNPIEVADRLMVLLHSPLKLKNMNDPIWYYRGNSCMGISFCERIGKEKILMNVDELLLNRIVAYINPYGDYQRDFVYVETRPDQPSGVYDIPSDLELYPKDERIDCCWEEFGVYEDLVLTRSEYDDGGAVRNGKLIRTYGAKLRLRYLTPYNFVICAKFNPFNSSAGDEMSGWYLHEIIMGRHTIDQFVNAAVELPLTAGY